MTSLKRTQPSGGVSANLSAKVYVRSTRSGKVQKIVREVYLREDIPCASKLCRICPKIAPVNSHHKGINLPFDF
jgi:exosome complex exonuclease DIS3/RRP44